VQPMVQRAAPAVDVSATHAPATSGIENALSEAAISTRPAEEGAVSSTVPVLSGTLPRLFEGPAFGGIFGAAATATTNAVVHGTQENDGTPLFPIGFPYGAPVPGTTFGSSSSTGISLELLAILALLYTLSRRGGSSVSPREVFRLVSSPRLVTELPG
jgi:hypothetical protein